jgi:hypothetical protein
MTRGRLQLHVDVVTRTSLTWTSFDMDVVAIG